MEDRELLELAAKAAGYARMTWLDDVPYVSRDMNGDHYSFDAWNPLQNDGDALRLAVKLRITPHIDGNLTDAESSAGFCAEPHFDDPCAATRRAIVRAAAEIAQESAHP
jgi:hypothetical protein